MTLPAKINEVLALVAQMRNAPYDGVQQVTFVSEVIQFFEQHGPAFSGLMEEVERLRKWQREACAIEREISSKWQAAEAKLAEVEASTFDAVKRALAALERTGTFPADIEIARNELRRVIIKAAP